MSRGEELVYALCHEVGNLLAAVRLYSELEDSEMRLGDLAGRAGSLIGLVRPLLAPPRDHGGGVDLLDALDATRRGLEDPDDSRLRLDLRSGAELPAAAVEAEVFRHLLLAEVLTALEELPEGRQLEMAAGRRGDAVAVSVREPLERLPQARPDQRPSGLALVAAIAEEVLSKRGGAVVVTDEDPGRRVTFAVPVAAG